MGVIREEKIAKKTVRGEKIDEESIKTSTHAHNSTWYLVLRMISGGTIDYVLKKGWRSRSAGDGRRPLRSRKEECCLYM